MRRYTEGLFLPKGTRDERWEAACEQVRRLLREEPVVADWLPDSGDWDDPDELALSIMGGVGQDEILAVAWSLVRIDVVVASSGGGGFVHYVPRPAWRARREPMADPGTYVALLRRGLKEWVDRERVGRRSRAHPGGVRSAEPTHGDRPVRDDGVIEFAGVLCHPEVVRGLKRLFGPPYAWQAAAAIARDFALTYRDPLSHPIAGSHKTGKGRVVSWVGQGATVIVTVTRPGKGRYSVAWRSTADRQSYVSEIWEGSAGERPGAG